MARVNRPKSSEKEVRVLQGRLAIETAEVISDSERGRIPDLLDSMFDRSLPHISRPDGWVENTRASPVFAASTLVVSGFRFLCCCPRVVQFRSKEISGGRLAREDICLRMSDLAESW
jgi:hypothetical protein